MWSNFHTNTCDKIPELEQKCWLDRPDSLSPPSDLKKGWSLGTRLGDLMNYNYRLASFYIHKTRKCIIVYIKYTVWWWVKHWHRPNYIVAMVAYIFNCTSEMFYIVRCPFLIFVHFGTEPPCMHGSNPATILIFLFHLPIFFFNTQVRLNSVFQLCNNLFNHRQSVMY